ncbi:hypothetical protein HPP92_023319 [Vanilla planifolia]|uniref:NET domain-containing protein n=1 Tax=Vanilla planifolia TaxID=51239 RepID=A0A835PV97_VANPL|nr:hypothetical protein HPP92_023319 [Vanilla planifolia]
MAEKLLNIFEAQWPAIESLSQPLVAGNVKQKPIDKTEQIRRPLCLPNSREMTAAEKGRLITNLQSLPEENLDIILQILRRRNLTLHQYGDQIEVEIDSVDTDTLWELHSKKKRKMELAGHAREESTLQPVFKLETQMKPESVPPSSQEDKLTDVSI